MPRNRVNFRSRPPPLPYVRSLRRLSAPPTIPPPYHLFRSRFSSPRQEFPWLRYPPGVGPIGFLLAPPISPLLSLPRPRLRSSCFLFLLRSHAGTPIGRLAVGNYDVIKEERAIFLAVHQVGSRRWLHSSTGYRAVRCLRRRRSRNTWHARSSDDTSSSVARVVVIAEIAENRRQSQRRSSNRRTFPFELICTLNGVAGIPFLGH